VAKKVPPKAVNLIGIAANSKVTLFCISSVPGKTLALFDYLTRETVLSHYIWPNPKKPNCLELQRKNGITLQSC
jgi:hypothetical protein